MPIRSRFGKGRGLQWRDRTLLAEAAFWLAAARAAVLVVPFRYLAPHLGTAMAETPPDPLPADESPDRIAWAIGAASRATPWRTPCLAEAIAGQRMLRRRRIPSTIYLGLTKDGAAMAAHAWLRCGSRTLVGAPSSDRFTPVATFAHAPRA